jgi:hypothetical protein
VGEGKKKKVISIFKLQLCGLSLNHAAMNHDFS